MSVIIFRHGHRYVATREISDDGPLSPAGKEIVKESAREIAKKLRSRKIHLIDLAVISGSIRCAQTFAIIWEELLLNDIIIREYKMRPEFYSLPEENIEWDRVYENEEYRADSKKLAEKELLMKHASHLVEAIAQRTLAAIPKNINNVLIVTHGVVDSLIIKDLTAQEIEPLRPGKGIII